MYIAAQPVQNAKYLAEHHGQAGIPDKNEA